jgi:nicotinamide mononucleotide transporter
MNISFLWNDFKGWQKQDYTWLMIASLSIIGITLLMDGSVISIISALANVVCVILVAQGKLSNYVWGTVGVVTYAYLAYTWGYFGETFLNAFYYIPMQFVGFYLWNKNQEDDSKTTSSSVVIRELSKIKKIIGVISIPVIIAIGAGILYLIGGKLVILDATTTVLSILAMVLMAMRMKEQWYLWIIVNMVSIYMWLSAYLLGNPDGIATLLMWIVFLLNSFYGLYKWRETSYKI